MKNKKEFKKSGIAIIVFLIVSMSVSYSMNIKINALEEEKTKVTETETKSESEYKGDCYDETMNLSDDVVIKIIEKLDSSLDINFVNKFDEVDEDNKPYSSIELSVSGNLDKIKKIESVLNDLNLNYKIENMDIKNPKDEKGNEKNYVDCMMTIKVV